MRWATFFGADRSLHRDTFPTVKTSEMKKVPSALKWLAETRARVAGQLESSRQVHELVSAQVAALEKQLAALKAIENRRD